MILYSNVKKLGIFIKNFCVSELISIENISLVIKVYLIINFSFYGSILLIYINIKAIREEREHRIM